MLIKIHGYQVIRASAIVDYAPTAAAQITDITVVADVSGSLNNTYFHIWDANNGTAYTVWFNVNSAGNDPLIAFTTPVEVTLATNATDLVVADAVGTALQALSGFVTAIASGSTNVVTVTNATDGGATAPRDAWGPAEANARVFATGFTFIVTALGVATTVPTNMALVKITGKMHSEKAFHQSGMPDSRATQVRGSNVFVPSPFNWTDVEMIIPQANIQWLREV